MINKKVFSEKFTTKVLLNTLITTAIVTAFSGMIYCVGQQIIRQSANDPQIQMARDIAMQLSSGNDIQFIVGTRVIDISKSLNPYVITYDDSQNVTLSAADLDGKIPQLPKGVLDYTKKHGENTVTWEPKPHVRQAAVIVYYTGTPSGYVLVGRSLLEVEHRERILGIKVLVGWLVTTVVLFILNVYKVRVKQNLKN